MVKHKSGLFPYLGGKGIMIDELQLLFDDLQYDCFYDLFGGSGAVSLNIEHSCCNLILNDMDKSLAIIYIAISDNNLFYSFSDLVENMYATTEMISEATKLWFDFIEKNPYCNLFELAKNNKKLFLELASASYVMHNTFYGGVIKKCLCNPNDDTFNKFEKRKRLDMLELFHKRLCDIKVTNKNALDIIDGFVANPSSDKTALLYLDVPYLSTNEIDIKTGRTYNCGMDENTHLEMLNKLNKLDQRVYKVIISNYSNKLYDNFANEMGWYKLYIKTRPLTCKKNRNDEYVNEYVYINYNPIIHGK